MPHRDNRSPSIRFLLAALTLAAWLALGGGPASAAQLGSTPLSLSTQYAVPVEVPLGQSQVFTTEQDISRLAIGDPETADVVLISPRSFYVLGQGLGRTNLQIFADGAYPVGLVDIEITVDTGDLEATLSSAVPNARIDVQSVNGRLRLAGSVPDGATLDRALRIAEQYGSEDVINALSVDSPQQVFLQVRIVEASRNAGRALGVSLARNGGGGNGTSRTFGGLGTASFGSFVATLLDNGTTLNATIDVLEERGLVRNLAEPTLAALSGETASFLAGGEVPIPVAEEDGQITVEYKEFGVRLSFTPVVLDDGLINMRLEPEVSQLDRINTYSTGAIELPSFTSRRASTTIELRDGQSFAIAGLLQRNNTRAQSQVPWIGDVPVIGALFRSASYQKEETDLVIIVTPHLSMPAAGPAFLATPLDTTRPTSDATFFLFGQQEITRQELGRQLRRRGIDGPFGHVLDVGETHVSK